LPLIDPTAKQSAVTKFYHYDRFCPDIDSCSRFALGVRVPPNLTLCETEIRTPQSEQSVRRARWTARRLLETARLGNRRVEDASAPCLLRRSGRKESLSKLRHLVPHERNAISPKAIRVAPDSQKWSRISFGSPSLPCP